MARPKNTPMQEQIKKEIQEALIKLMTSQKISQAELAEKTGIPKTTINGYVKGTSLPTPGNTEKLSRFFNVPKSVLDPRFREDSMPANVQTVSAKTVRIPILGTISCGDPIIAEENFKGWREESIDSVPNGNIIILEAQGDSMAPTIPDGAFVMIREQPDVENGEIAAVRVNGDTEATLKRIKKQNDMVVLMPDNPAHQPYIVTEDNPVTIIGKAMKYSIDL